MVEVVGFRSTDSGIDYAGGHLGAAKLAEFFGHEAEDFYTFAGAELDVARLDSSDPFDFKLLDSISRYADPIGGFLQLVKVNMSGLIGNLRRAGSMCYSAGKPWGYSAGNIISESAISKFQREKTRYFDFLKAVSDGIDEFTPSTKGVLVPNSSLLGDKDVRDRILRVALEGNLNDGDLLGWDVRFVQKYTRLALDLSKDVGNGFMPIDMGGGSLVALPHCAVVALDQIVDDYFERRVGEAFASK